MKHQLHIADNQLHSPGREGFTLLELTVSMGILVIVMSCFSAVLNGVQKIERAYAQENRAIVVLNNMVERLEAQKTWGHSTASRILKEEFNKSELAGHAEFSPKCSVEGEGVRAAILKKNGKTLAKVELNP